jgi:hypothetical protein
MLDGASKMQAGSVDPAAAETERPWSLWASERPLRDAGFYQTG